MIARVLNHYFPAPPIPLNHFDNFTLLVSVVLSAQTTDGKVNEVTEKLFKVAPTPQLLSAMEASEIQKIIQPVGLAPKKSVYLKKLSQMIIDKFDGEVPSTYESLESLPGVGHKTASVVMSQAFGEAALGVDTHVHRLSLRWGLSKHEKNVDKVQLDLHRQFPEEEWNKIHLQMIYFGREYCTAKLHEAKDCPMCSWVNKKDGQPAELTSFTPKKKSKGILFYEDRTSELQERPHLARAAGILTPCKVKIELTDVKIESVPLKVGKEKKVRVSRVKVKVEAAVGGLVENSNDVEDISLEAGTKEGKAKKIKEYKIKVKVEAAVDGGKKLSKKDLKRQAESLVEGSEIEDISLNEAKTPLKKQRRDENFVKKDEIDMIKKLEKPIKAPKKTPIKAPKKGGVVKNVVVVDVVISDETIDESVMKIEFTEEIKKQTKKKGRGGGLCQID
jgi:endonuclease-3